MKKEIIETNLAEDSKTMVCESGDCCEGGACEQMCGDCGDCSACGCAHHSLMGWLVLAFGTTFLLGAFNVLEVDSVNIIWPIIVVITGLKMLFARMCKCC